MSIRNINSKLLKKIGNKYSLKRFLAGVFAPIILVTSLSGCMISNKFNSRTNTSNNNHKEPYSYSNTNDHNEETTTPYVNNYSNSELDAILNRNITLDSSANRNIINYINSIKVYYPGSELFSMNQTMSLYNSLPRYNSNNASNIFVNNQITADELYNIVHENNKNINIPPQKQISDSDLRAVCDILVKIINNLIQNNMVDLNLLSEKISNLSIQNYSQFSQGSYDPSKNLMTFSIDKLRYDKSLMNAVVTHEGIHLVQSASLNELNTRNLEYRFGPCYKFKNLDMNPLYWNWFYEGATEYIAKSFNNQDTIDTYKYYIKAIDSVKVATMLKDNSVDDFEKLVLSNNLDSIFDYFECNTEEEKIEVLNMMTSFDIILKSGDIYKNFEKIYSSTYKDSSYEKFQSESESLKASVAQTLTKQFYKSLTNKYTSKQVSLVEIFSLISVFENEMSRLTWYASTSYQNEILPFIEIYNDVQGVFFQELAGQLGMNVDDLLDAYSLFNSKYTVSTSCMTNVSSDKKEFFDYILKSRVNDKMKSIYEVSQNKYNLKVGR